MRGPSKTSGFPGKGGNSREVIPEAGEGGPTHKGAQGTLPRAEVPGDLSAFSGSSEAGLLAPEFQRTGADTPWQSRAGYM